MSNKATSDNSNGVGLFPFLAVLLCTMGALLVLLVVLAQRAGQQSVAAREKSTAVVEQSVETPTAQPPNEKEAVELAAKLKEVLNYQAQLRGLREKAERRLRNEQAKLSHLEEHTRRLEHELARFSLAAQQLEATEQDQTVDRDQAERELARLQELIKDTAEQIDELRENSGGKRSYAIVPYKGHNGTYRQPIYIECCKEGVIIHPEGTRFEGRDFAIPSWSGNPLAATLRASHEYLNAKAAQAGEPEPPDPYPLLLIRPDGIAQYRAARSAITAWDSDFGYEFVGSDWKLEFPSLPDPQLARIQQHAQLNARQNLARRAAAAPSRFRALARGGAGVSTFGSTAGARGGSGASGRFGGPNDEGTLAHSTGKGGTNQIGGHHAADKWEDGATAANLGGPTLGTANGNPSDLENDVAAAPVDSAFAAGEGSEGGETNADAQHGGAAAQTGSQTASGGTGGPNSAGSAMGTTAGGQASGAKAPTNSISSGSQAMESIAKTHGRNWAIDKKRRGGVPIRRPIHVVVRSDRIAILPSQHASSITEAAGDVIMLDESYETVSNKFVDSLRTRIEEWGLAGNGLHWRPVLELHVGPNGQQAASQVVNLLKDSGVEIRLPQTAQSGQEGAADAIR